MDKKLEDIEEAFEYKSDEESIFGSFQQDLKKMPPQVTKKFSSTYESRANSKVVNDMLKRFSEKS